MKRLEFYRKELENLKHLLTKEFKVESIGFFGSVVRDDFSPGKSDIDIIVDVASPVGIEFIDLADFLERELKQKVDLVSRKGVKPKYLNQIEPEIVYVYKR